MTEEIQPLLAALGRIPDPKGGDIASSGRVQAPRVKEGVASLIVDVTGLSADTRASLERAIRAAVVGVPGVRDLRIAMTADKVQRTIVAIGSGKGGVGKSTLSANLAVALARSGKKVGLLDADIYGPSQPRIMGNESRPELADKQIVPVEAYGVKMLSIGSLVEAGSALAWRGPMAATALGQLADGDWGETELLVVDLPPGTGDIQMSLIQKWKPAGAVIVSTPQDLALIDATRAIDLFRKMDVPVLGLVENMAGYVCPHCGEESDPFGQGGAEAAARVMQIPFLGRVPLTLSIRQQSDAGRPPASGEGAESEIFARIAARLVEELNRETG
ncbi:Mrp/NBP35 family ATP-binding protein [Allosphingosinicella indica]|uniref:Iron-sulfur cluster carrier protein n=1 Tax=Allosphingosinicella indica TaxID=941907 RepID=A0A1X7FZD7_9SPHN|nr:Mrp/NBP35 family ATP-binding protein [Allosphingosinicella indica]SMF61462.1 ATP-binding protein involved in chromosome partitioning [Allosphingosinicella indica]